MLMNLMEDMDNKILYFVQQLHQWLILMKNKDLILKIQNLKFLTMKMLKNTQIMMMLILIMITVITTITITIIIIIIMMCLIIITIIIRQILMHKMIQMIIGINKKLKMQINMKVLKK